MLRAAAPRSAQQLAGAVDAVLRGSATSDATLARHQSERDRLPGPFSRTIDRIAAFDWDLGAVRAHLLPASKVMQAEVRTIEIADGKEAAA